MAILYCYNISTRLLWRSTCPKCKSWTRPWFRATIGLSYSSKKPQNNYCKAATAAWLSKTSV